MDLSEVRIGQNTVYSQVIGANIKNRDLIPSEGDLFNLYVHEYLPSYETNVIEEQVDIVFQLYIDEVNEYKKIPTIEDIIMRIHEHNIDIMNTMATSEILENYPNVPLEDLLVDESVITKIEDRTNEICEFYSYNYTGWGEDVSIYDLIIRMAETRGVSLFVSFDIDLNSSIIPQEMIDYISVVSKTSPDKMFLIGDSQEILVKSLIRNGFSSQGQNKVNLYPSCCQVVRNLHE